MFRKQNFSQILFSILVILTLALSSVSSLKAQAQTGDPKRQVSKERHKISSTGDEIQALVNIDSIQESHPAISTKPDHRLATGAQQDENGHWFMPAGIPASNLLDDQSIALTVAGPDGFGYTWDDSIALNWIDTTASTNTGLTGSGWGQATGLISLPFPFTYYKNTYSQVYIAASGYLAFTQAGFWDGQQNIPSATEPNNVIAPYWAPTFIGTGAWVHYMSGGSAPNRYFVVEWHDITGGGELSDEKYRFEAILYENGDIDFQYHTMTYNGDYSCGEGGIENSTGLDGLSYSNFCYQVPSGTAVRFYRPPVNGSNLFVDPSFEVSSTIDTQIYWGQSSANFGTPLCPSIAPAPDGCGDGDGTAGPRSGSAWAWFGGVDFTDPGAISPEVSGIWQNVTFPACGVSTIQFYLWIGYAETGSGVDDFFGVVIDGNPNYSFKTDATQQNLYQTYIRVSIDVSSYSSGPHQLAFTSVTSGQTVNFNLDDVSLIANCAIIDVTIGGTNVGTYNINPGHSQRANYAGVDSGPVVVRGVGNATISAALRDLWWNGSAYTSSIQLMGLPQDLLSDTYIFPSYNNVSLNDQLRFGNVGNAPTTVTVTIGGQVTGTYPLDPNQRQKVNYAGLDSGPVIVHSSGGVPIIASIRDAWINNGVTSSFSQLMGLPQSLLSDTYIFPSYNNINLSDQLRFGNVGNAPTTVTITIGGQVMGTYDLQPNQRDKVSYPGLDSGPVIVKSSNGVPIIASLREAWLNNGVTTSYFQMMGLPHSQLSDKYVFPVYDNVSLSGQLRFGNVGNANTTVTVTIAGVVKGTYDLAPNQRQKVSYAGLDDGPIVIQSSNGVPIVAALRDAWLVNGVTTSFSQLIGLPGGQLSDVYVFPSYNNVTYDNQLRIGVP